SEKSANSGDTDFGDDIEIVDLSTRYTIEGVLGKGGMGEVQLATDNRLKRKVAIKRVLGDMAKSQTAVRRFMTEAQSIAALNHPNIVQVYDYGRDKDGPFLILEYVAGNSLLDRCQQGAIPLEEAITLICHLCDGLTRAHELGIIHRDLKPANVLLTKDGVPKLTDFGLARVEKGDTGQTMSGAVLGTLDFMSPEQRRDATQADARSDLWSLAATLYQMVTGKSPKIIRLKDVPQALQDVLDKALEDAKDDRYQTAVEFRDALRGSLKPTGVVQEVTVDLSTGECPKCHTKNEVSRKFCRECFGPLRVKCLSCEVEIPIWDKGCGECGANQPALVSARQAQFEAARNEAAALRSQYGFEESLKIAQEIAGVVDPRLQHLKGWAEDFIASTQAEKIQQEQNAAKQFAEAQTHRMAFDDPSAIHAMESIPEAMRTQHMQSFVRQLQEDHEEANELDQLIATCVKERTLDGLLAQVNRAVELRGDREDFRVLQTQLQERNVKLLQQRDKTFSAAGELLKQGQAKEAFARIQPLVLNNVDLQSSDKELKTQLNSIARSEDALSTLVKESNADGVLEPEEIVKLLVAVEKYLQLNPRHEKILRMKQQLIGKI
ncbi:MAG: serine/threonine-protein kinase, partial [Planctomycetota bacterium]